MIETTAKELLENHKKCFCRLKRKEQDNSTTAQQMRQKKTSAGNHIWECIGSRISAEMIWEADSMTNFECMKQKIVNTVMGLDEIELLNLADDTEMSTSGAERIFNCTVCEEVYGECGTCSGTSECNRKYLEWCRKEYHMRN